MARFRAPSISSCSSSEEEAEDDNEFGASSPEPPMRVAPDSESEADEAAYTGGDERDLNDDVMYDDELTMFSQGQRAPNEQIPVQLSYPLIDQDKRRVMQASFFGTKPAINRKHSRDSDGGIAGTAPGQRHSFEQPLNSSQPFKKYARIVPPPPEITRIALPIQVPTTESIFHQHGDVSGITQDFGLAYSRSFRIGWGPRNLLVAPPGLNSSRLNIYHFNNPTPTTDVVRDIILPHFLTHSPKWPDEDGIPCVNPKADKLTFASIAALFQPSPNYLRDIFKCGEALFDPLVPPLKSALQQQLKRKKRLSKFLQATLSQTPTAPFGRGGAAAVAESNSAELAYRLLTTHRISKAADVAVSGGYPRLALLIAHAGSTDNAFRLEMKEQLNIWRAEKGLMDHIEKGVRKCYALLSGDLGEMEKEGIMDDLKADWKRFFGVLMWFVLPLNSSISDIFEVYEELRIGYDGDGTGYVEPLPSYIVSPDEHARMKRAGYEDGAYILIKLFSSPFTTLSDVLHPRNFSVSPLDFGMSWILGVLLGRVHGIRDFVDREQLAELETPPTSEDEMVQQGHSPSADLLTASYVAQLEATGDLQEAVFVALFGEASVGRKRNIKLLLSRNASLMIPGVIIGLQGSLQIPVDWIGEAQALYHQSNGDLFNAYLKFLDAGRTATAPEDSKPNLQIAHRIALNHLSPPALLTSKPDLDLLTSIFEVFLPFNTGVLGDEWIRGGQLMLNYASILDDAVRLSPSADEQQQGGGGGGRPMIEDAVEKKDKIDLVRRCHRLLGILPDMMIGWFWEDERVKAKADLVKKRIGLEIIRVLSKFGHGEKDLPKLSVITQCTEDSVKLDVLRTGAGMRFLRSVGAM